MQDRHVHFNMKALSKNQRRKYCRFPEYRKCFNERIRVLQEFKAQGLTPEEIAEIMKVPVERIKSLIF